MQILEPYTGKDFTADIFLKNLVKYNLLGQYVNICAILCNTPSNEFTGRDVCQCCLSKFEEMNLLDEIEKKHPQSMKDAVRCLICNLNQKDIDVIYGSTLDEYGGLEYLFLGM